MATEDTSKQTLTDEEPKQSSTELAQTEPPQGIFECAKTGRARCRACGETLRKGQLRCGEQLPNPFGEGMTTYWFHSRCAAERRPETFLSALRAIGSQPDALETVESEGLQGLAEFGAQHPKAARLASLGIAPSGRARCRCCRELIEKGAVRVELSIFQDGRFDPMGYLHVACTEVYMGARPPWARLENKCSSLSPEQRELVRRHCG